MCVLQSEELKVSFQYFSCLFFVTLEERQEIVLIAKKWSNCQEKSQPKRKKWILLSSLQLLHPLFFIEVTRLMSPNVSVNLHLLSSLSCSLCFVTSFIVLVLTALDIDLIFILLYCFSLLEPFPSFTTLSFLKKILEDENVTFMLWWTYCVVLYLRNKKRRRGHSWTGNESRSLLRIERRKEADPESKL